MFQFGSAEIYQNNQIILLESILIFLGYYNTYFKRADTFFKLSCRIILIIKQKRRIKNLIGCVDDAHSGYVPYCILVCRYLH